jgi:hypothetical protein
VPRKRITIRLRSIPFRVTRVTVGGRRVKIDRRRGVVRIAPGTRKSVRVRFTGRTRSGRARSLTRTYRACR